MMYITPYGKLISDENISENVINDKIEIHSDSNNDNYILFNEDKNINIDSILYWKNYIYHNIKNIKNNSNVKYFVIKFKNSSSVIIWDK